MDSAPTPLRLIGKIVLSTVDGPGERAVIHFAGCSIGCPGCFNPHTHAPDGTGVWTASAQSLARDILAVSPHVSISGGEPTDQMAGLRDLLQELWSQGAESIVLYSGRTRLWLAQFPIWHEIDRGGLVDVLIDGPYIQNRPEAVEIKGSNNQRIHFLTENLSPADFAKREVEFTIDRDGQVTLVGFPDADMIGLLA